MDARIQLQKAVVAANRLPLVCIGDTLLNCSVLRTHIQNQPNESARYASQHAARETLENLRDTADSLTEELFILQWVRDHLS